MMSALTPCNFQYAGLWVGLAVAAIFLATAVRLRRYREPILIRCSLDSVPGVRKRIGAQLK